MKKLFISSLLFLVTVTTALAVEPTNISVVDGPGGWFRDDRKVETQNPDDFVIIPGDLTINGSTKQFGNTSSIGLLSHKGNVLINLSSIENVTINGTAPTRKITDGVVDINQVAGIPNTRGLNIDTNAAGQRNTNALVINYTADGMQLGEVGIPININLIAGTSSGGRLDAVSCTKVGNGGLDAHCFHVNPGIDVVHQVSGEMVFADIAFKFDDSGSAFTNVTAAFESTSNNVRLFEENNDIVYIGHVNEFSNIAFNLATSASGAGIKPTVEYSDGVGGWTILANLSDATNGLKNSGSMSWIPGSLAGWVADTVNGIASKFWVRIIRTQNNLGTVPTESFIDIVEGVNFLWTEDGDLIIRDAKFRNISTENLTATGDVAFTNLSGEFGTDFVSVDGSGNFGVAIAGGGIIAHGFANRTTAYDFTPVNTWSTIPLNGVDGELVNITHSKTVNPERIAVDIDGVFQISYYYHCRRQTSPRHCNARLWKNSTTQIEDSYMLGWAGDSDTNQVTLIGKTFITSLSAGDYFEMQASTNFDVPDEIDIYDDANLADSALPRSFASISIEKIGD